LSQVVDVERLVDEQRLGRFNVNLFLWSFLAMFADGYDLQVMAYAAPELARLWHVPPPAFRVPLVASLVGILFGALLLGYIGDRLGRKRAIVSGCIVYGVATLGTAWAGNLTGITVLRFVTGLGLGGLMPNTIALNSELSPKRWRATLVVLMFIGITLGAVIPGPVAAWVVPRSGWTVLFLIGGIVPLGIALGVAAFMPESVKLLAQRPARRRELLETARQLRRDLVVADDAIFELRRTQPVSGLGLKQIFGDGLGTITALIWVLFAAVLISNFFLNSWLPLIFSENGLTPERAAIATSWYHIGACVGGIAVSIVLDRFGTAIIAVLFAVAGPCVAAIGWPGHSFATLAALVALSGFSVVGVLFGINACTGLIYPTEFRSQGVGWTFAVGRFGSIVGLLLGGTLLGMKLPMQQLFVAPAVPMVIGTIAAVWLTHCCYLRFEGLKLDDKSAAERAAGQGGPL
jgi:AAHS family 4-hydroxybenzoate transporter-like MFS transporter